MPDESASAPPSGHNEGVCRLDTREGEAAIVIELTRTVIAVGETVEFRLVNRGRVTLMSGEGFGVERWSAAACAWTSVPVSRTGGPPTMFSDVGWLLRPGDRTPTQRWPIQGEVYEPGWYRVVKSATYEGEPALRPHRREMVARTRVRVDARR